MNTRLDLAAKEYTEASALFTEFYEMEARAGHRWGGPHAHEHIRSVCSALDDALDDVLADGTPHSFHDAYWELIGAVEAELERIALDVHGHKPHPPKKR